MITETYKLLKIRVKSERPKFHDIKQNIGKNEMIQNPEMCVYI